LKALNFAAAPHSNLMLLSSGVPKHPCIAVSLVDENADFSCGLQVSRPNNNLESILRHRMGLPCQEDNAELFSQGQVVRWLGQLLLGLEHLHARNIFLGNLVLANVSIDERGLASIALGSQDNGEKSELCVQVTGYAAPEVVLAKPFGASADLYSLGVMAWVLLTSGGLGDKEPGPPRPRTIGADSEAGLCSWRLLRQCVVEPPSPSLGLEPDAQDLVRRLTELQPQSRPTHNGVRHSALLAPLLLPDACDEDGIVKSWLGAQAVEQNRLANAAEAA